MSIVYQQEKKLITIQTMGTTYQMKIGTYGHLLHLYYGKKLEGDLSYLLTFYDRGFSGNPYDAGEDRTFSMDALPQEYPCLGNGDFRATALKIQNADGSFACDLRFESLEIRDGKYSIPGLPTVHTLEGAQTLVVTLKDKWSGVKAHLYYGIIEGSDVITRAAVIENADDKCVTIYKAASCSTDFLYGNYELLHFHGRHGMERILEKTPVSYSGQVLLSRRGTSSHQENPFFILAEQKTTETSGNCYGFSLLYSGNFKGEVNLDQYQQTRVVFGLSEEQFAWKLNPGESFYTPEAAMCFSPAGLTNLSWQFQDLIRYHICREPYQTSRRPILINNWEATYFDFTGERIIQIARQAKELGVEMLVLDDGWFGRRDSDLSGLGDWFVNEGKLKGTIGQIADQINGMGMKFGLWIEPEMVSEDSKLFREHPDWVFRIPGREPVRARYQLVLDFSRPEVVDGILKQIEAVIRSANIEYIKMDMNRHLTDIYSVGAENQNQGAILHKYVCGVYAFLEKLKQDFPQLLIEGCSGGGGRFDAGMLYYTPQIWCSDNTDAIERIFIQYGTSFGYPISAVGSHVSAVPNHQTGRSTPINTRAVVAMAGSFGYELDLNLITEEEKEQVKQQIIDYKRYWNVIHNGRYYRLNAPYGEQEFAAWEFADRDGREALLNVVILETHCNPAQEYVALKGLDETAVYEIEKDGTRYTGSALMNAGLPIPRQNNEYCAWQVHLVKVDL